MDCIAQSMLHKSNEAAQILQRNLLTAALAAQNPYFLQNFLRNGELQDNTVSNTTHLTHLLRQMTPNFDQLQDHYSSRSVVASRHSPSNVDKVIDKFRGKDITVEILQKDTTEQGNSSREERNRHDDFLGPDVDNPRFRSSFSVRKNNDINKT